VNRIIVVIEIITGISRSSNLTFECEFLYYQLQLAVMSDLECQIGLITSGSVIGVVVGFRFRVRVRVRVAVGVWVWFRVRVWDRVGVGVRVRVGVRVSVGVGVRVGVNVRVRVRRVGP